MPDVPSRERSGIERRGKQVFMIRPVQHWSLRRVVAAIAVCLISGGMMVLGLDGYTEFVGIPATSFAIGYQKSAVFVVGIDGLTGAYTAASLNISGRTAEVTEPVRMLTWPCIVSKNGLHLVGLPLWTLILIAVTPLPLLLLERRARRLEACRCGYNLTGNVSGVCPECGEPVRAVRCGAAGGTLL